MKIFKICIGGFCVFSIFFTVFFGAKNINGNGYFKVDEQEKIILTVWQIDTFEGGTGSRTKFLLSVAKDLENSNKNLKILVSTHTVDSAEESFSNNVFPDVISYGNGLELKNISKIESSFKFKAGNIGEKPFAIPWCRGNYVLIKNLKKSKNQNKIIVSQSPFTLPTLALFKEGINAESLCIYKPLDAYVNFVSGNAEYMIGTQRDLDRLSKRDMEVEIKPLTLFNDLYQYVSICSSSNDKIEYANTFINLLLSDKWQNKLKELKMFSAFKKIGYEGNLSELEKQNNFSTISPFVNRQDILEIQYILSRNEGANEMLDFKINKLIV